MEKYRSDEVRRNDEETEKNTALFETKRNFGCGRTDLYIFTDLDLYLGFEKSGLVRCRVVWWGNGWSGAWTRRTAVQVLY